MLDINLFRKEKGGDPDKVRESQRRRYDRVEAVDEVIAADDEWRRADYTLVQARTALNALQKRIQVLFKAKARGEAAALLEEKAAIEAQIATAAGVEAAAAAARDALLRGIGNLVADGAPVDNDEDRNPVERTWGDASEAPGKGLNHVDLLHMIGGVEYKRGTAVAGNRGYFLKGPGARLNMALATYGVQFLAARDFTPMQTPYFMETAEMAKCAQLEDFDEELYKVSGEGTDKYLVATSEQPMCAYHAGEWVDPRELPTRYAAFSTCFRKEAGSHGRDTLGIFRVHQFDKVEQFVLTGPDGDASWAEMDSLMANAEAFYKALALPHRVVGIVSGKLNKAAAKKYDVEGWYPSSGEYRELVSCSNCTDYQARRLGTRYGTKKMGEREKRYVHMLNSTLCATTRVLCCILENYQTVDGVMVPEPLRALVGTDFFPFVRPAEKV